MTREAQQQTAADVSALGARLKDVVLSLETVEAMLVIAGELLSKQAMEYDPEIALVLMRCAANPLHRELNELKAIIEEIEGLEIGADEEESKTDSEDGHETDVH